MRYVGVALVSSGSVASRRIFWRSSWGRERMDVGMVFVGFFEAEIGASGFAAMRLLFC